MLAFSPCYVYHIVDIKLGNTASLNSLKWYLPLGMHLAPSAEAVGGISSVRPMWAAQ